jgi:hypothetical protein
MMCIALLNGLLPSAQNIDAWGHLGGFLFGIPYTLAVIPRAMDQQGKVGRDMRAWAKVSMLILVVTLLTLMFVLKVPGCEKSPNGCER